MALKARGPLIMEHRVYTMLLCGWSKMYTGVKRLENQKLKKCQNFLYFKQEITMATWHLQQKRQHSNTQNSKLLLLCCVFCNPTSSVMSYKITTKSLQLESTHNKMEGGPCNSVGDVGPWCASAWHVDQ